MYTIAKIAVEDASYCFDKEYSYLVPEQMTASVRAGCRVRVPFGRGNRGRTGLVLALESVPQRERNLKPVASLLDEEPLLDDHGLLLLRYLKECTFCTWFDALKTLIPSGLGVKPRLVYSAVKRGNGAPDWESLPSPQLAIMEYLNGKKKPVEEATLCQRLDILPQDESLLGLVRQGYVRREELLKQKVMDEKVVMVRLCDSPLPGALTKRQEEVMAFLEENGTASLREICYYNAMTRAVPDKLREKGVLEYYDIPRFRNPYGDNATAPEAPPPSLG
ncbi:hypothetical protein LJC63_08340 [Ruminococcaceae bacterium OttesenSCG-928-L11]|nr:hypothetical protein [Ruminococcaceae bacterium OttesenSCG-928-L11]